MMHGEIWAESELHVGSTFHFTVRLKKQQGQPAQSRPLVAERQPAIAGLHAMDALTGEDNTVTSTCIDKTAVEQLLRELRALVASDNIDAANVAEKLKPLLKGTVYKGDLDGITRAMDRYDFDAGLEALRKLAGELDINL